MKLFIFVTLCVVAGADRLENTYLPPSGAQTAGGDGNVLNAPSESSDPSTKHEDSHSYRRTGNEEHSGPQNPDAIAATVRFLNENNADGAYNFEYETENRISQHESGELRHLGGEEGAVTVVRGSYSYMGPDGVLYAVEYIADENGFQPSGEHIHYAIQKGTQIGNLEENLQLKSGAVSNNYAGNHGLQTNKFNLKSEYASNNDDYSSEQKATENSRFNADGKHQFNQVIQSQDKQEIHANQGYRLLKSNNQHHDFSVTQSNNFLQTNKQHEEQSGYPQNFVVEENLNSGVAIRNNQNHITEQQTISSEERRGYPNNAPYNTVPKNTFKNNQQAINAPHGFIPKQGHSVSSENNNGGSQHPVFSGSHIPHDFNSQNSQNHTRNSISSGFHEFESPISSGFGTSHRIKSNNFQGYSKSTGLNSNRSHNPSGYTINSESHQFESRDPQNHSGSISHESQVTKTHSGSFAHESQVTKTHSGSLSHGFQITKTNSGYPVSSESQGFSGYPATSSLHPTPSYSDHTIPSGSHGPSVFPDSNASQKPSIENHQQSGYPNYSETGYPSNVPQGFVPQQEQVGRPISGAIRLDSVDSSQHHHDGAEEEQDSVVVEAAGRRYQPPQVPGGRATPGQQVFDEKTGYQY